MTGSTESGTGRKRKRFLAAGIGVVLAGLAGTVMAGCGGCGHGNHGHGWRSGHGHWGHRGHMDDPEEARERAESAAKWMLRRVDASEQQQQQVTTIVRNSVDDLFELAQRHRSNSDAFFEAFSQTTINRGTIDEIRAAELQLADAASSKLVTAMADIAEVLTPEQRAELMEHVDRHRH